MHKQNAFPLNGGWEEGTFRWLSNSFLVRPKMFLEKWVRSCISTSCQKPISARLYLIARSYWKMCEEKFGITK